MEENKAFTNAVNTPPIPSPDIVSFCLGQYIDKDVAEDLCRWLTTCIQNRMEYKQLRDIVDKLLEGDEKICGNFPEEKWESLFHYPSDFSKLPEFYKDSVEKGAVQFSWRYEGEEEAIYIDAK